jgi:E3 ubiquitin-protein ligase synoviolin
LTNLFLVAACFFLYGLQRLLYGPLRPIETEQLYEKAWFAVTETCLAMTIFRGELGGWFLVMFVCLLVGKVWGWIGEGRVEILEQQPPANPRLFHTRLASSLILSVLFDFLMLDYSVRTVLEQARPDMMVMFGFEFAVLTILSTSTLARYGISLVEIYINHQQKRVRLAERRSEIRAAREEAIRRHQESGAEGLPADLPDENDVDEMELDVSGWEEKGRWVFYLDLITDFFKLVVYLSFFAILFTFYGLPIHILRDVVVTIRSFGRRIVDFMRYRNATRDMHERYPDATVEEISREDVCIICREEMVPWQPPAGGAARPTSDRLRPKKLPCGHILHFACLRSWLERQQNCPTCRRPVVVPRNRPYQAGGANNDGQGAPGGQPGVNQPAGANAGGDGQPRARIYQLGPFRIGFGAGRGDVLQNLHQQIHGNNPMAPAPVNVPAGAQQIGFGFGFGHPPAAQPPPVPQMNWSNVQGQLQQIEQQIAQEIQNLRLTADQLHVVRLLQAESQRLRNLQANPARPPQPTPTTTTSSPFPPPPSSASITTVHRQFTSNSLTPAIGTGDSRLPEGLVLPQGWTLLPLHRLDPVTGAAIQPSFPPPSQTATTNGTAPVVPPTADHPTGSDPATSVNVVNESAESVATPAEPPIAPDTTVQTSALASIRPPSPSQEWTDVTPDTLGEEKTQPAPSGSPRQPGESIIGAESSNEPSAVLPSSSSSLSTSSKGKAKAATVEDFVDDDDDDDES